MCNSYSTIFSSSYLGLGSPTDDLLSKLELANIVQRQWSYRMESVRQSEQGVIIAKSETFTLGSNEDEIDLTAQIPDFSIPMWVEQQSVTYLTNPIWNFVPTVNISMLQEQRGTFTPAVAFYGDSPTQVKAKFSFFGNELWTAQTRKFRVWYLPQLTGPTSEDSPIELPNNIVNMLGYDTMVAAIPLIQFNMSKQLKDRPELEKQMEAMKGLFVQYKIEQERFEVLFLKWAEESRGAHRARRRRNVLSTQSGVGRQLYWQN